MDWACCSREGSHKTRVKRIKELHEILEQSTLKMKDFETIWKRYDKDGSGYLEMKEVSAFTSDLLDMEMSYFEKEIKELEAAMKSKKLTDEQRKKMDRGSWNGAGIEKMKGKFKSFKAHLTNMKESDAKLLFQEWDTDTNGKITKQEFKSALSLGWKKWHIKHPQSWLTKVLGI